MSDNITLPREVVQGALEALVYADSETRWDSCYAEAITALRAALAAPSEDIETLRRENERLREALREIAAETYDSWTNGAKAQRIAESALKEVPR